LICFPPFKTWGRASGTSQDLISYKNHFKKQWKLLFSKNISEVKKIPNEIIEDYIIFPENFASALFEYLSNVSSKIGGLY
jgi:hypothetical protein